jgi:5-methylcytosine-specific restriction endonuclease McrA
MGIDYSSLKFGKGDLRIERKRDKRLSDEELEREARKAVRQRDGARCSVPGCREPGSDLHHLVRRSRSRERRWLPENLVFLCRAHHQLEHAGKIHIARKDDGELIVTGDRKWLAFKL